MSHKQIGRLSFWIFFVAMGTVYISYPKAPQSAHNFDYRSYINWESHGTERSVESMSEERLMLVHALEGKKVPSLELLQQTGEKALQQSNSKSSRNLVLKPEEVIDNKPATKPLQAPISEPILIPDPKPKEPEYRKHEVGDRVGVETTAEEEDQPSKNPTISSPFNLKIYQGSN